MKRDIKTNIKLLTGLLRKAILALFMLCMVDVSAQLDPQFSSYMFSQVWSNPAFAGNTGQMSAFGLNRQQWIGFTNNPQTSVFSFDAKVNLFKQESGVGISFINDNLGLINSLSINFIYSYRKRIWNGVLGLGINTGFINQTWNGGDIYLPLEADESDYLKQIESDVNSLKQEYTDTKFDLGLGAIFEHDAFYAGLSLMHLPRPTLELSSTDKTIYLFYNRTLHFTSGYRYTLTNNPKYELHPSVYIKTDGIVFQTDLNLNVWYEKRFYGGLGYRLQDGFIFLAGIKLRNGLNAGYAFDLTTSRMRLGTYGSQEIYLSYIFSIDMNKQKSKHKSVRFL